MCTHVHIYIHMHRERCRVATQTEKRKFSDFPPGSVKENLFGDVAIHDILLENNKNFSIRDSND